MTTTTAGRPTLREQQLKLREDVILREVNALLAEKGYDLMTVDEVAARVGLAKPSLYKHFASKEALAAALARRHRPGESAPGDRGPSACRPRSGTGWWPARAAGARLPVGGRP